MAPTAINISTSPFANTHNAITQQERSALAKENIEDCKSYFSQSKPSEFYECIDDTHISWINPTTPIHNLNADSSFNLLRKLKDAICGIAPWGGSTDSSVNDRPRYHDIPQQTTVPIRAVYFKLPPPFETRESTPSNNTS
jgi:hypothetical protein